jgi:maltooligosyltrehalose synthase
VPVAASTPVKLAIFDFELEDTSAAVSEIASDATELANATETIRQLLAQSGRYRVVATGDDADAAKTRSLHDCGGCDAAMALKLGADQSLVGVIRRVSRTEYTFRFALRDARTGDLILAGDSGLRMGANYSWSKGAVRLIGDRLLEQPQ